MIVSEEIQQRLDHAWCRIQQALNCGNTQYELDEITVERIEQLADELEQLADELKQT